MNLFPEISIVVCCFNHDKWLERCIRSLVHQEYLKPEEYEIILVDDASQDATKDVIKNFEEIPNLKIIPNKENIGLPASLNTAIRAAKGRYIVRVDSDDYVTRKFLFLMQLFLNYNREYQAVACDYVIVDEFENTIDRKDCTTEEIACGVMFRKECLFDIGLYDERFKMREGHKLKRDFEKKFSIGHLPFPLYKYRQHGTNRTADKECLGEYDARLEEA